MPRAKNPDPDALFVVAASGVRATPGPVYQGVGRQVRRLLAKGKEYEGQEPLIDAALWSGTIAQAYSLAASIDAVDARGPHQANGVPLATMHGQLDALLARMNPEADDADPMTKLLEEFERQEEEQRARRTAKASHPEE